MNLINANIESIGEAANKMVEGEVFYSSLGLKIFYSEGFFTIYTPTAPMPLQDWSDFKNWKIEKPHIWERDANEENPIICFVTDSISSKNLGNHDEIEWIIGVNMSSGEYVVEHGGSWKYAWPVEPKDCWKANDE